jgi:hypothetical protein
MDCLQKIKNKSAEILLSVLVVANLIITVSGMVPD